MGDSEKHLSQVFRMADLAYRLQYSLHKHQCRNDNASHCKRLFGIEEVENLHRGDIRILSADIVSSSHTLNLLAGALCAIYTASRGQERDIRPESSRSRQAKRPAISSHRNHFDDIPTSAAGPEMKPGGRTFYLIVFVHGRVWLPSLRVSSHRTR